MALPFNPIPHKDPPSFSTTAATIIAETDDLIKTTSALFDRLVQSISLETATFDNVIRPLAEDENKRSEKENHLRFYASTHPDGKIREASYAAADKFSQAEADRFSDMDMFALVDSVKKTSRGLDHESIYYLEKLHRRFLIHDCGVSDPTIRAESVVKRKRISEVARQMRKNMANEKTGLWLTRQELQGLPDDFICRLTVGEGEHGGFLWVSTKTPFSNRVMKHASLESTRKKMHYAVMNRMPENIPLHRELILLRDETARMLGWENHFAFKTTQKMMQGPKQVKNLLTEIRRALTPVAEEFAEELLEAKKKDAVVEGATTTENVNLFFWDRLYYETKANEKSVKTLSRVSEYFELNNTLDKLLAIYIQIFGVKLVTMEISTGDRKLTWHEDVQMFSAWMIDDSEPQFLGYAYLDLFPREGKYTHAGQYSLQRRYKKPDGTYFDPCSVLVMNYMKPTSTQPSLLDFNDVRSLFHELGHMYHCLLSRPRYARLHSVDVDFVETPSIMLEQFFVDPQIIHETSQHYSYISPEYHEHWMATQSDKAYTAPPAQIIMEEAAKLGANETVRKVRASINELFYSTYDLRVHSAVSHTDLESTDLAKLYNDTRTEIYQIPGGEELVQGQSVFRAIQGKYDAGYYAYLLGKMFAINIFEAGFKGDALNRENGRRYRDMILCKGGTQNEMKTLTEYLGHEPRVNPYLRWINVDKAIS